MNTFDILYEIGEDEADSNGAKLAEVFLNRFLTDVDGLDHTVLRITNDIEEWTVTVTIETRARITPNWFENADATVEG